MTLAELKDVEQTLWEAIDAPPCCSCGATVPHGKREHTARCGLIRAYRLVEKEIKTRVEGGGA